jgi:hypothetical protein
MFRRFCCCFDLLVNVSVGEQRNFAIIRFYCDIVIVLQTFYLDYYPICMYTTEARSFCHGPFLNMNLPTQMSPSLANQQSTYLPLTIILSTIQSKRQIWSNRTSSIHRIVSCLDAIDVRIGDIVLAFPTKKRIVFGPFILLALPSLAATSFAGKSSINMLCVVHESILSQRWVSISHIDNLRRHKLLLLREKCLGQHRRKQRAAATTNHPAATSSFASASNPIAAATNDEPTTVHATIAAAKAATAKAATASKAAAVATKAATA